MEKIKLIHLFRTIVLLLFLTILSANTFAQNSTVKGKVTDEKGSPLPGAIIRVKSGKGSTSTDTNGAFSLSIPGNEATLVVSYIGYSPKEISARAAQTISVSLAPEASNLSEVVVVGYGTQRKKDVTGMPGALEALPLPIDDSFVPPDKRLTIWQLENNTCRYPYGDYAPYMFCGYPEADLLDNRPYCKYHTRINKQPRI